MILDPFRHGLGDTLFIGFEAHRLSKTGRQRDHVAAAEGEQGLHGSTGVAKEATFASPAA